MVLVVAWLVWDCLASVERGEGLTEFIEILWFVALAGFALELDTSVRLLAKVAPVGTLEPPSGQPVGRRLADGREPARLPTPDARRLARAPAYAEHLERLRWLHPVLTAMAVASSAAALAWVDIPRPADLVVAGLAGVSISAAIAVAVLRGWVRLAVALARSGAAAG